VDDTVDNVRHLPAPRPVEPAPPRGPHRGTDPSDAVSVEIDDAARDVRVALAVGWRDRIGADRLGEAVAQAVTGAVAVRAAAWAAGEPAPLPGADPPPRPAGSPAEVVDGAWRDLREIQVRLAQLYDTAVTVTDPAGQVRITVRGGQLVSIAPAVPWAETADDADLADRLADALRAALAAVGDLPERALGSPRQRGRLAERS
jgi:hypothetical protein